MEVTETQALRERMARRSHPQDVALALRLRGLPLRGPWPGRSFAVVRGQRVQPDREPGYLVIEGRRRFSSEWL